MQVPGLRVFYHLKKWLNNLICTDPPWIPGNVPSAPSQPTHCSTGSGKDNPGHHDTRGNNLILSQRKKGSMKPVFTAIFLAGALLLFTVTVPVSAASCGCSPTIRLPTIWDDNEKQWSQTLTAMTPLPPLTNGSVNATVPVGSKVSSPLVSKMGGTLLKRTNTKSAGFIPFKTR